MSQHEDVHHEDLEHAARMGINGGHGGGNDGRIEAQELRNARAAIQRAIARLPWLGQRVGDVVSEPALGYHQEFQQATVWTTGVTTASSRAEAYEVHGNIRARYNQVRGSEPWHLGVPLTDEAWARDHVGRFNRFERGSIYWTEATGAWDVRGDMATAWSATNAELGFLGYPTGAWASIGKGSMQKFQKGALYWFPQPGNRPIPLPQHINDMYTFMGGPLGVLGFPIVPELAEHNAQPGTFFKFEAGKLHWRGTPDSITVEMFPRYTFTIDSIHAQTLRSREKDTLQVAAAIGLGLRDPISASASLGRCDPGVYVPHVVIPNVAIADDDNFTLTYMVTNNGHQSNAVQTVESAVKTLAQKTGEIVGEKAAEATGEAIGKAVASGAATAVGAYLGSAAGIGAAAAAAGAGATVVAGAAGATEGAAAGAAGGGIAGPLGAMAGAALGALTGWLVGLGIDLIVTDCDGTVAMTAGHPVGGRDLVDQLAATPVFTQTVQYPGSDSPAGCGANSFYEVTWSVKYA